MEWAFLFFNTFLENSIQAHCIPRQIPKNGILFSLTYLIAEIFPSTPLFPNPGATITPSIFLRFFLRFLLSKSSDKIHLISTLEFKFAPA